MKISPLIVFATCILPVSALAQVSNIFDLEGLILDLLTKLGYLFFAMATVFFLWGVVKFIMSADDAAEREKGKKYVLWGIIALTVLVSLWGIVAMIIGSLGISTGGIPGFVKD